MRKVLMLLFLLVLCVCLSKVAKAEDGLRKLTEVAITDYQVTTDQIIIEGVTDHRDSKATPAYARGVRVFVNGFVTHTREDGSWKLCVPRVAIGSLMDPDTKVKIEAIELLKGNKVVAELPLVDAKRKVSRMETFDSLEK